MILGQSAIEYLMTYGWMLLAIAVVGGTAFSLSGAECIENSSGFTGEEVGVSNFGLASDNSLEFVVENRGSEYVEVNSLEADNVYNDTSIEISAGDSETIRAADFIQSDSCNTLSVEMNYDMGNLENLTVSGTVTGQYEFDSVDSPSIDNVEQ